jgi:hypothetical protein
MKEKKGPRFYCRKCKKIVDVYEGYREEKVLPELSPEFDVVRWCCVECENPVVEVTEHRNA